MGKQGKQLSKGVIMAYTKEGLTIQWEKQGKQ
jgi:hypothetical protein